MSQEQRTKAMQQTDQFTYKRRFGLFSQLVSTAIGDNKAYQGHKHARDENNKPKTEPRNIFTSPSKSGQLKNSYFNSLNPLANFSVHDAYIDEGRRLLQQEAEIFNKGKNHEQTFFPAPTNKTLASPAYPWKINENRTKQSQRHRNSQGGVIIEPRGFYTNNQSNVSRKLSKFPNHIADSYDNQQAIQKEKKKLSKSKQVSEVAFRPAGYGPKLLNKSKSVYGCDVTIPQKKQRSYTQNHYKHQSVFRCSNPNKSGIYGYLSPFPAYKPNPLATKSNQSHSITSSQKREPFKSMSTDKTMPSPSITTNPINMRRFVNHSFSKRF